MMKHIPSPVRGDRASNGKAANGPSSTSKLANGNGNGNGTPSKTSKSPLTVLNGRRSPNVTSSSPVLSREGAGQGAGQGPAAGRRAPSPARRQLPRRLGATPPPAELDAEAAARWRKYNGILESLGRRDADEEAEQAARPPAFDHRGVELLAALAPALGKFLFLAKAKSFSWWKHSVMKVRIEWMLYRACCCGVYIYINILHTRQH
jgi:hypothetical protein